MPYAVTLTRPDGSVVFVAEVAKQLVQLSDDPARVIQQETQVFWEHTTKEEIIQRD